MAAYPDLWGPHRSLINASWVLIIQKLVTQMLRLTPCGNPEPRHPSENTPKTLQLIQRPREKGTQLSVRNDFRVFTCRGMELLEILGKEVKQHVLFKI